MVVTVERLLSVCVSVCQLSIDIDMSMSSDTGVSTVSISMSTQQRVMCQHQYVQCVDASVSRQSVLCQRRRRVNSMRHPVSHCL